MLVDVSCSSATLAIRRITQMHPPEFCRPEAALARPLEEFPFGLQPQILQVYIPYGPYGPISRVWKLAHPYATEAGTQKILLPMPCKCNTGRECLPACCATKVVQLVVGVYMHRYKPSSRTSKNAHPFLDLWQVTCDLSQDRYTPKRPF